MTERVEKRKVYLIDSGEYTKIGFSVDPETRLATAQSGNPRPMELAGVIKTNHAPKLESKLHDLLGEYQVDVGGGSEWFDLPDYLHETLAGTDRLSAHTLRIRQDGARGLSADDPLLYLDSTALYPAKTEEEYRQILQDCRDRKDELREIKREQNKPDQSEPYWATAGERGISR